MLVAKCDHVILATTTFYKDEKELRYLLVLEMAKKSKDAGYTLVV